jgi:flagellar biosynthesis/type III secretory pathway protein FliH
MARIKIHKRRALTSYSSGFVEGYKEGYAEGYEEGRAAAATTHGSLRRELEEAKQMIASLHLDSWIILATQDMQQRTIDSLVEQLEQLGGKDGT